MTKTITPKYINVLLSVSDEFRRKKIEVLMYEVEQSKNKKTQKTMSAYNGVLTKEEAEKLQEL